MDETTRDDRPAFRPFRVAVRTITVLNPHFTRVTFTGDDLHLFGRDGLDQRIKLILPIDGVLSDFGQDDPAAHLDGDWYARWLALPDATRNPLRTYTVRAVRPDMTELDVDLVVHAGGHGPAAQWLAGARPGDELVIVGPDVRSLASASGIDWHPGTATDVLLAGDETAVPAISGILESLRTTSGVTATVFLEIGDAADALELDTSADVTWLTRDPDARGARLHRAVAAWAQAHPELVTAAAAPARQQLVDVDVDSELLWEVPTDTTGEFYAWLAGEAGVIKGLRRLLVTDSGIDRRRVAFMGYWREGRAEGG